MGLVGADVDQMRTLARTLTQAAERLEGMASEVTGRLSSAAWTGPDASRYRSQWHGDSLSMIRGAVGALRAAATAIERNAVEQDQASTGTGGGALGGSSIRPNGSPGVSTVPEPARNPLVDIREWLQSDALWPMSWGTLLGATDLGPLVPLFDAMGLASDSGISPEQKLIEAANSATDLGGGLLKGLGGPVPYLAGVAVSQWGDVAAQVAQADFSAATLQTTTDYAASNPGGAFDAAKDAVLGYVPKLFSNLVPW
jgi:hypothetical protein